MAASGPRYFYIATATSSMGHQQPVDKHSMPVAVKVPAAGAWHQPSAVALASGAPAHIMLAELPAPTLAALSKPPWADLLSFGTAEAPSAISQLEDLVNAAKACVEWKRGVRKEGEAPPRFPPMLAVCAVWNAVAAAASIDARSNGASIHYSLCQIESF